VPLSRAIISATQPTDQLSAQGGLSAFNYRKCVELTLRQWVRHSRRYLCEQNGSVSSAGLGAVLLTKLIQVIGIVVPHPLFVGEDTAPRRRSLQAE
jgi:hypothetical protein